MESSSKNVSTVDSSFLARIYDNGVFGPLDSAPPENLTYLQDRLNIARDSPSPTELQYHEFVHRTQSAPNEQTMLLETSRLLKEHPRGYYRVYNQALTAFPKSIGPNIGISAPQPDMYEGLGQREFGPFPVDQELGGAAVPYWTENAITLSHLAGEWKAGGRNMKHAQAQAAYDGACLAYGRNKARLFLENPDPAGYAYVQTFTIDGTTLNTFAHYLARVEDRVEYYQYPTSSSFMSSSYEDFKRSRQRIRNLQDIAHEFSIQLRDELKEKWLADHRSSSAPNTPAETTDSNNSDIHECKDGDGEDTSLLLDSSERIEPEQGKTRRKRTRVVFEEPGKADHGSNARKIRRILET